MDGTGLYNTDMHLIRYFYANTVFVWLSKENQHNQHLTCSNLAWAANEHWKKQQQQQTNWAEWLTK